MRKLLIVPMAELTAYVSREWFATFTLLREGFGWDCVDILEISRLRGSLADFLRRRFGEVPQVVLFREGYWQQMEYRRSLVDAGARIYVMTEDMHRPFDSMAEALRVADGILSPYAPRLASFYPDHDPARLSWVPHAAGPDFLLLPIHDAPRPLLLVSGQTNRDQYPFRYAMSRLAERRPELAAVRRHPGYGIFEYGRDPRVGLGYAETIRRFFAAFSDGTRFLYLVAKLFEIPAAGALLIADRALTPQLAMLGFQDDVHYVSAAPHDAEKVIERVLDRRNFPAMDAIRRRGHRLVRERHTILERARKIDAVCV